jgi:hypothetical protein
LDSSFWGKNIAKAAMYSFMRELELILRMGFAEPENPQDAKLPAPVIFMLANKSEYKCHDKYV